MVRFAILYFLMLLLFVILVAAPLIVHRLELDKDFIHKTLWKAIGVKENGGITDGLLQPLDAGLNDTMEAYTGSHLPQGFYATDIPTPSAGDANWHRLLL